MTAWMRNTKRCMTEQQRRKPETGRVLRIPYDADPEPLAGVDNSISELHIEATNGSSDLPFWLDDHFWMEAMRRWANDPLIVHIEPTRNALLHSVVLHQLYMLRRVAPRWRLIGHCYASDLATDTQQTAVAVSPYDELRIIDAIRPGRSAPAQKPNANQITERIRKTQEANQRSIPVLIWQAADQVPAGIPMGAAGIQTSLRA